MARVFLVQYLCPERHCILAVAYEEGSGSFEEAKGQIRLGMQAAGVNPWCGICGSRDLSFEEGLTPFASIEEAMTPLLEGSRAQQESRQLLDALGVTHDARRREQGRPPVP
jgi:hypothetical protein